MNFGIGAGQGGLAVATGKQGAVSQYFQQTENLNGGFWSKNKSTVIRSATADVDGNILAFKLFEDATAGFHFFAQNINIKPDRFYTWSILAKAAEHNWLQLFAGSQGFGATGVYAFFNLSDGTIVSDGGTPDVATASLIADGWWHLAVSKKSLSAASMFPSFQFVISSGGAFNHNYTGNGSSGVYVHRPMLSEGLYRRLYVSNPGTTLVSRIS